MLKDKINNYVRNYIKAGNVVTLHKTNSVRYVVLSVNLKTKEAEIAPYYGVDKGSYFRFHTGQAAYNAKFPYTLYVAPFKSLYCVYDSYGAKIRLGSDIKKEYLESMDKFEQLRLAHSKERIAKINSLLESKTIQNLSVKAKLAVLDLIQLHNNGHQEVMYVRNKIFNVES